MEMNEVKMQNKNRNLHWIKAFTRSKTCFSLFETILVKNQAKFSSQKGMIWFEKAAKP